MKILITPSATVSGLITASCDTLFDIISDPLRHPEIAGSGEVMSVRMLTPPPIRVGTVFQSHQCMRWLAYPTRSFVRVYDPPYRFVWFSAPIICQFPFGQLWGFELVPIDSRLTAVNHLMRIPIYTLPNLPGINALVKAGVRHEINNMSPTLYRLAAAARAIVLGEIQIADRWGTTRAPFPALRGQTHILSP